MRFQFTRSSRKHRIGRTHAREALTAAGLPTVIEDGKLRWVGSDSRGVELTIIGIPIPDEDLTLIIHVVPIYETRRVQ